VYIGTGALDINRRYTSRVMCILYCLQFSDMYPVYSWKNSHQRSDEVCSGRQQWCGIWRRTSRRNRRQGKTHCLL